MRVVKSERFPDAISVDGIAILLGYSCSGPVVDRIPECPEKRDYYVKPNNPEDGLRVKNAVFTEDELELVP